MRTRGEVFVCIVFYLFFFSSFLFSMVSYSCVGILEHHSGAVKSLALSSDGLTLASGCSNGEFYIWSLSQNCCLKVIKYNHVGICSVALSYDGSMAAFGLSSEEVIRLWKWRRKKNPSLLRGHRQWVCSVAFDVDGKHLITGSYDQNVCLWDLKNEFLAGYFEEMEPTVRDITISKKGKDLLIVLRNQVVIRNRASGEIVQTLSLNRNKWNELQFTSAAITNNGQFVFTSSWDTVIRLWSVSKGTVKKSLIGHTERVNCLVLSQDGRYLVSGSDDGSVIVWDILSKNQKYVVLKGHQGPVNSVAISQDNNLIVSGSDDKKIILWRAKEGPWASMTRSCE